MFVDNVLPLFLWAQKFFNVECTMEVLKIFGATLGAKINIHKSVTIWVGNREKNQVWGQEEEGVKWFKKGEATHLLGLFIWLVHFKRGGGKKNITK